MTPAYYEYVRWTAIGVVVTLLVWPTLRMAYVLVLSAAYVFCMYHALVMK